MDTIVRHGTASNVAEEIFGLVSQKNTLSIFGALQSPVFYEAGTEGVAQNGTTPLFPQSRPHSTPQNEKAQVSKLSGSFLPFKRIPANSARNGLILKCSPISDRPLFYTKIISTFLGTHFITNPETDAHESTSRH